MKAFAAAFVLTFGLAAPAAAQIENQLGAAKELYASARYDEALTVLGFELGGERYGVDVMLVRGVRNLTKIARVPGIPSFYRGVVNVRGQILTVLDLRTFFDIPVASTDHMPEELVTVRANDLEIGLLADSVSGVVTVPREAIVPSDNIRYALGVTAERLENRRQAAAQAVRDAADAGATESRATETGKGGS